MPNNEIIIKLIYDKNKIKREMLDDLQDRLKILFVELTKNSKNKIHQLNMLTPSESNKILIDWNKNDFSYPENKKIHQLFEEKAKLNPHDIAVVFNEEKITYRDLDNQANLLATFLKKLGVADDVLVTINSERNIEMIVGILGILKAGGVYVPIDMSYPNARIVAMFQASKAYIFLNYHSQCDKPLLSKLDKLGVNIITMPDTMLSPYVKTIPIKRKTPSANKNLAYVVFTSGSTGIPKVVAITHKTIVNLIGWQASCFATQRNYTICQFASIGFDVSLQEIFFALSGGHKIHIAPANSKKSTYKLLHFLTEHKVNIAFLPTALLDIFCNEALLRNVQLPTLTAIVVAGEALRITQNIRDFFAINNHVSLINHYGPSETHVVTSFTLSKNAAVWSTTPPIGKPIANCKVYVLNKHLQPVTVGVVGELYIGGPCLAYGYLNQNKLTQQAFIINPFNSGTRLYKTGDLVKWAKDGNLIFIGRINNQVKIRGFRVEPDEINYQIKRFPYVTQSFVTVYTGSNQNQCLVAYIVLENNKTIFIHELKDFIGHYLPRYMIPNAFVIINKMPLTVNGKIDKNAFPPPEREQFILHKSFKNPHTKNEILLTTIWQEILDVKEVSINDNFFDLGGQSLLALQLLQRVKQTFDIDIPLHILFEQTTIEELAKFIEKITHIEIAGSSKKTKNSIPFIDSLISLQPLGNKPPLFLIHPIGGAIFWYIPLVKYLDTDRPVFAIQDPGFSSTTALPFDSIEEMAAQYVKMIKHTYPHGPYLLSGASSGGVICIEMAKQLLASGSEVLFIGLFDSWVPHPDKLRQKELFEIAMRRQYNQMQQNFMDIGIDKSELIFKLQWKRLQMLDKYNISKIPLKLTLFKAQQTIPVYQPYESPLNQWENYSTMQIILRSVPGDHETMFQTPHVKILAHELRGCLENIESTSLLKNEER